MVATLLGSTTYTNKLLLHSSAATVKLFISNIKQTVATLFGSDSKTICFRYQILQ